MMNFNTITLLLLTCSSIEGSTKVKRLNYDECIGVDEYNALSTFKCDSASTREFNFDNNQMQVDGSTQCVWADSLVWPKLRECSTFQQSFEVGIDGIITVDKSHCLEFADASRPGLYFFSCENPETTRRVVWDHSATGTNIYPSSAPTTLFNAQNFSVSEPNVLFYDSGSDFFLNFTYVTGDSSDEINYTLYKENCESAEDVSNILSIVHETREEVDVLVDKKAIEGSSLVTQESAVLGYSKGTIKFCVKTEAMLSDMSVAFRKTNVKLSYDLTENSFEVIDNTISANNISEEEIKVTTAYGVEACICKEDLECETSLDDKVFEQNGMIYICVYPNITSASSTEISNFDMKFKQGQQTTYTAVRITDEGSFATAGLSSIKGNEEKYLVASRLITALFEGGKDSFDVVGNVLLRFKTRRLKKEQNSNLRSMQENPIGTDAGESLFRMNVKIAKADSKVSSKNSDSISGVMVTVVGGLVTLSIVLVFFKKMKK